MIKRLFKNMVTLWAKRVIVTKAVSCEFIA
jgi:hypothetical protein